MSTEVTSADIARLAGVGRAAVSNWRRRHPDFPTPVGGPPTSPTFALADVEAWLNANGRIAGVNTPRTPDEPDRHSGGGLPSLMSALLPLLTRGVLLDPAGGDGCLVAAAERFGPGIRYIGEDDEPALFHRSADAVISIAPLSDRLTDGMNWEYGQPSRNDFPLAWVQICLSYLKPGSTAVVAVPFATAVRASGRRIRAELLRAGALTHVIGLPEGAGADVGGPWQIWLLTRPVSRPAYMLRMVDLLDYEPDDLPSDDTAWAAVFADAARTRDVPSIELLDEDVLLIPAAHITAEARDVGPEYGDVRRRYADAVHRIAPEVPAFAAADALPSRSLVTVSDLIRSGAVTIVERDAARPGDVLIPANPGSFDAVVVAEKERIEAKAVLIIRCDPAAVDPYFLACFLRSETNRRQSAGTMGGTFRLDVRRARVPDMPLSEQRRYGESFRDLMAFIDATSEVATTAADAASIAIYGLTSGVFAPTANGK